MTQHKATPEQWAEMEQWAGGYSTSACLIELRDRIAAMETQRETEKACIQEIYDKLDRLKVQHESNWSRIVELEEAAAADHFPDAKKMVPALAPAGLVERVAQAIADDDAPVDLWLTDARAAILAVAEWLREEVGR
jgi:hypothetical protein